MALSVGDFVGRLKSCSNIDYDELRGSLNRMDITPADLLSVKADIVFNEDGVIGMDTAIDHVLKSRTEAAIAVHKKILESWKMPHGLRSETKHYFSLPADTNPIVYVREDLFDDVIGLFNDVVNDVRNSFDCPCHRGIGWRECSIQCTISGINRGYGLDIKRWSDGMLK